MNPWQLLLMLGFLLLLETARVVAEDTPAKAASNGPRTISTADVSLLVTDLDQTETRLKERLKQINDPRAAIVSSDTSSATGAPRQGHWRVRLPADRFNDFLNAFLKDFSKVKEEGKLGVLQQVHSDWQDVSKEYDDLQRRIKKREETRPKMGDSARDKKAASEADEILRQNKEQDRADEELDGLKGQLQRLEESYLTLTIQEFQKPPEFGDRLKSTFSDSLDWLTVFGGGVVLVGVALAPWLPVLAILALTAWLVWRRRARAPTPPAR
jgi:hypothetical protein